MSVEKPVQLAMRLRIPEWLTEGGSVGSIEPVEALASAGSLVDAFAHMEERRLRRDGLPMRLRMEAAAANAGAGPPAS